MNDAEARRFLLDLLRTTGLGSYRAGDLLYATGPNTLAKLRAAPDNMLLHGGSTPAWAAVSMADSVVDVLAPANGGTGLSSYVVGDLLYASGAAALARLAGQTTTIRKFLLQVGDGVNSAAPFWDTISSTDIGDLTEAAQDAAAALIQNGTGISFSYNDAANTLTPTVTLAPFSTSNLSEGSNLYFTDERAQDAVGGALTDTTEIDFTYDDAGASITAALKTNSVVYSKLQQVSATNRVLGRISSGAGNIEELASSDIATIIAGITQTWSGPHTFSSSLTLTAAVAAVFSNATPRIAWVETDQITDEQRWDQQVNGKAWALRTRTDADGAGVDVIRATRGTGTALASIALGNATNNPTYSFLGTGTVTLATLIVNGSTVPANGVYLPAANTLGLAAGSALAYAIDPNGRLLSGTIASISVGSTSGQLQLHGAGSVGSSIARYSNNSTGCVSTLAKSRSATVVAGGAVTSGDSLGKRQWAGDDGATLNTLAAYIEGVCDGAVATAQVPGRVDTYTATSGGVLTLAQRIDSSQNTLAKGSLKSDSATGGMGYATGAGGAVTQSSSRTTGVTLNKVCGAITLVSAAGSASYQTFTVTNSAVAATDVPKVVQKSGTDKYLIIPNNVQAGSFDITFATTGGTTTEQPVFSFALQKAVAA